MPEEKVKRARTDMSYSKWAHMGIPMLISAGDDTKLFAYSANEFTKFGPHDICPAPQRPPIHLVCSSFSSLLLVQASSWLDIFTVHAKRGDVSDNVARVKSKGSRKIICSSISPSGRFFSYSDHVKPCLFELKKDAKNLWSISKMKLPSSIPFAHSMIFSADSSRLMISGHDRMIYVSNLLFFLFLFPFFMKCFFQVVDVGSQKLSHRFTPCRKESESELPPTQPPITKMFTSLDGQWLAAVNCFGDVYIFNLETQRCSLLSFSFSFSFSPLTHPLFSLFFLYKQQQATLVHSTIGWCLCYSCRLYSRKQQCSNHIHIFKSNLCFRCRR